MKTIATLSILILGCLTAGANWIPGGGGPLPSFDTFTPITGQLGFVYVSKTEMQEGVEGADPAVELGFHQTPGSLGATSFSLEYDFYGEVFDPVFEDDVPVSITSGSKLDIPSPQDGFYRVRVNGGEHDGMVSNDVYVQLSSSSVRYINAQVQSVGDVDLPFVGAQLIASGQTESVDEYTPEFRGETVVITLPLISYQWYRVNPATFELIEIPDATSASYTLTQSDVGYLILCRIFEPDIESFTGYCQVLGDGPIVFPNPGVVFDPSVDGFLLELFYTLDSSQVPAPEEFQLTYYIPEFGEAYLPVDSVTQLSAYELWIEAEIPEGVSLLLDNSGPPWEVTTIDSDPSEPSSIFTGAPVFLEEVSTPVLQGGFAGPVESTQGGGSMRITVSQNGTFSGCAFVGEYCAALRGQFDGSSAVVPVFNQSGNYEELSMLFDVETGYISVLDQSSNLFATLFPRISRSEPVALRAPSPRTRVNALLLSDEEGYGHGFVRMKMKRSGSARVVGRSGESRRLRANMEGVRDSLGLPMLVADVRCGKAHGKRALSGILRLSTSADLSGELDWWPTEGDPTLISVVGAQWSRSTLQGLPLSFAMRLPASSRSHDDLSTSAVRWKRSSGILRTQAGELGVVRGLMLPEAVVFQGRSLSGGGFSELPLQPVEIAEE